MDQPDSLQNQICADAEHEGNQDKASSIVQHWSSAPKSSTTRNGAKA
jgi:hypothetical protein